MENRTRRVLSAFLAMTGLALLGFAGTAIGSTVVNLNKDCQGSSQMCIYSCYTNNYPCKGLTYGKIDQVPVTYGGCETLTGDFCSSGLVCTTKCYYDTNSVTDCDGTAPCTSTTQYDNACQQ